MVDVIEEIVVVGKRPKPLIELPALECPDTILPTPANMTNFFSGLATFPEKILLYAQDLAGEEKEKFIKQAEDLQKIVDDLREFFKPYDPDFKKIEIPEKEWEIMIQRFMEEYPMYIQSQIMSILSSFVSFTVPILGISIDVLKLCTDREYLDELGKEISGYGADMEAKIAALREGEWEGLSEEEIQEKIEALRSEEIDRLYALLPDEYKFFDGTYGLENSELKAKQLMDFIKNECTKFMNGQMFAGFGGIIGHFSTVWNALGLPALPVPLEGPDVGAMIKGIIDAEKAKFDAELEKLGVDATDLDKQTVIDNFHANIERGLEDIEIFGFKVSALLGGDFVETTETLDFKIARMSAKLKEFRENWQTYLLKKWMETVTAFFDAIGLGTLTQWITFSFCDFIKLIGIPTAVDLSAFDNISTITKTMEGLEPKDEEGGS